MEKKRFSATAFAVLMLLNSSCEGLFGGIYDNPELETKAEYGFISSNGDGSGTIYIDCRSYTRWTYLDFKRKTTDTSNIRLGENAPSVWDMAIHHYDVKTNGGSALQTAYTTLSQLKEGGVPSGSGYFPDSLSRVVVDMSGMMEGKMVYESSMVNFVLSGWLDVNTSEMPPIYTLSGKVYVLKLADGSSVALLFSDFTNAANEKGFVTIRYKYPL